MTLVSMWMTLTLLLVLPLALSGEVFSSVATLRRLRDHQAALLESLELYLVKEERRLQRLRRLIRRKRYEVSVFESSSDEAMRDIQHPTIAYALIRDWSFISDIVYDNSSSQHLRLPSSQQGRVPPLPDKGDRAGAQRALIRLQRVYNLSLEELSEGTIRGHRSHRPLDGRDFYEIGLTAFDMRHYTTASRWLEEAVMRPSDDLDELDALYWAGTACSMSQQFGKAVTYLRRALHIDPYNETLRRKFESVNESVTLPKSESHFPYTEFYPQWKVDYEEQCRHGLVALRPGTWCEYQIQTVAYAPYKVEVMNQDPWVIMYHDVITDAEVETIKDLATPELNRAVVGDPAAAYAVEERISKVAWLWDHFGNPVINKLSRRVERVTGLITKYYTEFSNSEPFQVVNYGMGGQYEPHLDVYVNEEHLSHVSAFLKGTGDRVATFMFYLSDVKEGGATVFPLLDVYVPPIKKSAAFWYNIHRNGTLDLRTQHAGCPVLVGEKWVANKWIREFGQLFRRPCGPAPTSTEMESRNAATGL